MRRLLGRFVEFFLKLADVAASRVDRYGARYISFGAFSLINYIFPFYMWSEHHSADPVVLSIRIIAGVLNFFLLLHETWFLSLKRFLPLYWYFTVMFSLPFFTCYMLLLEGISVFWVINVSLALVLSLIVLDFKTFLLVFSSGAFLAIALAFMTGISFESLRITEVPFQIVYLIVFSGAVAIIFSRNRERIEQEKMDTVRAFGATVAHEMRTPLSTISLLLKLIKRSSNDSEKTSKYVEKINREVSDALLSIDMMLTRVCKNSVYRNSAEFSVLSMKECVFEALDRYPFCDGEREKINVGSDYDFQFVGRKDLVRHILLNLIQNAMYQIQTSNKGSVTITLFLRPGRNVLSFKDDATGVEQEILDKIFTPMVSSKPFGSGLGLSFCKQAMEAMGGEIKCFSVAGEYAEFLLEFPIVSRYWGQQVPRS